MGQWDAFEDPEQRARDVFTPIVRTALLIGALGLFLITPLFALNKAGAAVLSGLILCAAVIGWLCMRANRARLGAAIIVSAFWCAQTVLLTLSNGGFIASSYVFSTLLAGVSLGRRAATIVGLLGIAAIITTTTFGMFAGASGSPLPVVFPATLPARAALAILILIGSIWTLHVFIRRLEEAFGTAARELAERKRGEHETQRRAVDFEEAQRLAQSGSWEFEVATGEHRWSRQHFRIHGLDPDVASPSFKVFIERVPAEEQNIVAAAFQSVYLPPYYIRGEYRVLRAPGDMRVIDGRIEGVRDDAGKVVRLRGTSVDVTESRRAEELRELELAVARCLAGVEEMEPAISTALATVCERENWQVGGFWRADEHAGELILEHWWVQPQFAEVAQPIIDDGKRNHYGSGVGLIGHAWRTGTAMWVPDVTKDERVTRPQLLIASGLRSAALMPVTDGSRVVGVLVFAGLATREEDQAFLRAFPVLGSLIGQFIQRRQTEQQKRALQTQLYQSQKLQALGTLAGGIAHEFNNMIAVIIGNASMALQDVGPTHPAKESLDQIAAAGERARALTRRILMFGRAQPDTRKTASLVAIVQDAMRLLRATLPARITLELEQGEAIPPVRADGTQLHQLVVNLCTNAAHAIGNEAGTITISLSSLSTGGSSLPGAPNLPAGDYVCLSVADTGIGIDPQIRDRIFEPFFTTKKAGEGAGLGLSVVHSIVQGHEGAIDVTSAPGSGSTFHVYLPAASRTETAVNEAPSVDPDTRSTAHIFYVDDDSTIVSAMERMLSRRGYRVSAFTSARKAIEQLRAAPAAASIFVSDYNMAEMSGLDVAREALQLRPDLPFVIVSGFIDERVERAGRALGVREFVHKPDLIEMCAAIDRLCSLPATAERQI
jgi:signal transduction histidine kinase/CheY-like chemotaxis protein/PAS domain-containing protein